MARITIGNARIAGFVNLVAEKDGKQRLVIGTGSYKNKDGEKVFKESLTVFVDPKFDGDVPAKGAYVIVSGDLQVSTNPQDANKLQSSMNVRFKNQLTEAEAPKAAAPSQDDLNDDI